MRLMLVIALYFGLIFPALAEFQPYPNAKANPEASKAVNAAAADFFGKQNLKGRKSTTLTTSDSFEQVLDYYRTRGTEYKMPYPAGVRVDGYERDLPSEVKSGANGVEQVPSGIRVKQAFIIFDGAPDLEKSKDWVTIQRPLVTGVKLKGTKFTYGKVLDVTAVTRVQKRK